MTLSPRQFFVAVAALSVACEGDVFPIQGGQLSATSLGGSGGRSEPDPSGGSPSGGASSGGASVGGMGGAPAPARAIPIWNSPVKLSFSGVEENDTDPSMSPDGLELYFTSATRAGGPGREDIFRATRPTVDDDWGVPVQVAELNSTEGEAGPFVLSDGVTIIFARHDMDFTLYRSTRPTVNDPWGAPAVLMGSDGNYIGLAPAITADGLKLYYSTSGAGLDVDIFEATRTDVSDPFGPRQLVTSLQTSENDWDPVTQDDLTIYYNRGADLFGATRTTASEPYSQEHALTELNSQDDDTDPWLSLDGKTLLFSSKRDGHSAIYEARRD